jgi:hypothetical protein
MELRHIIITSLMIIAILIGLLNIHAEDHRRQSHLTRGDFQWLGIINIDNNSDINLNSVLNGEDVLLVVDDSNDLYKYITKKIPQAKNLTPDEVFNPVNIHLLDENNDGILNINDPIFHHLLILRFYDNGQHYDLKSLKQAGIVGIYVNKITSAGNHLVLMTDGTHRVLYNVNKFGL